MISTSIVLLILSAISKAIMDYIATDNWSGWWSKYDSWKTSIEEEVVNVYKWKDGKPENGEAFFGSSTFLSFTTDGWHFFQMIFLNFLLLGTLLFNSPFNILLNFLIISIGFRIVFEITYRIINYVEK